MVTGTNANDMARQKKQEVRIGIRQFHAENKPLNTPRDRMRDRMRCQRGGGGVVSNVRLSRPRPAGNRQIARTAVGVSGSDVSGNHVSGLGG